MSYSPHKDTCLAIEIKSIVGSARIAMMSTMKDRTYSSFGYLRALGSAMVLGTIALLTPATAHAQSLPDRTADYLKCTLIADMSPRLACYDAVSASLRATVQNEASPAVEAQPEEDAEARARANFGASTLPRERQERNEPDEVGVLITSWRTSPLGKLVFTTEDGQVWRQSDSNRLFPRSEQFNATIKKGMMGSYFLKIEGIRRAIRVKRVR